MAGKIQTKNTKSSSLSPLKRKSDLLPAEKDEEIKETKRQKPIKPPEELRLANQNFNEVEIKLEPFISVDEEKKRNLAEEEDEEESVISSLDDNEVISDDYDGDYDDVEGFLSDESLEIMEFGNILLERVRPRDSLKVLSRVKMGGNDGDDVSDLDFCIDEQDVDEEEKLDVEDGISDDDDDDDVEKFLSDDSLTLMEVGNILSERMRPRDSLKVLSPIKMAKNVGDDVDDCNYCVDDEEEDEEDEDTKIGNEEEQHEIDNDGNNNDDYDDDVEKFLSDDSLALIEVGNILLDRTRPCVLLKLVTPIKKAKNVCDDVDDCDYCVDEQEEDKEDGEDEKEVEMEEQQLDDKNGNSDDDDDIEKFLSDDSLTLIEVDNILLKRLRTRDTLKFLSPIMKVKIEDDDVNDLDYCVDEHVFEEDEETETETNEERDDEEEKKEDNEEEEHKQVDKDGNNDNDDVENLLPDDSITLVEVDNILLEPVKKAKNDVDDVNDCNDFVNEQEEDEEDEETETNTKGEKENNEMMKRRNMRIRRRRSRRMMKKRIIR